MFLYTTWCITEKNILEEHTASSFKLKMRAVCSSKTLVPISKSTWHHKVTRPPWTSSPLWELQISFSYGLVILLYTQTSIPAECKSVLEQLYMIILYFGSLRKHIRTLNVEENFTLQKLTKKFSGNDENNSQLNMDSNTNVISSHKTDLLWQRREKHSERSALVPGGLELKPLAENVSALLWTTRLGNKIANQMKSLKLLSYINTITKNNNQLPPTHSDTKLYHILQAMRHICFYISSVGYIICITQQ
jgi:hypothetical protein